MRRLAPRTVRRLNRSHLHKSRWHRISHRWRRRRLARPVKGGQLSKFQPRTHMNLTPRQLDVLVAIRNYRHLHGYSPTMQELADQLGTSKVTVFEHVGALEKKRVLRRDKHKARSLEIIAAERLPDKDRST